MKIIFEGIDGVGKTTLAKLVASKMNLPLTYEPHGNNGSIDSWRTVCQILRNICLKESFNEVIPAEARELLMLASRAIQWKNEKLTSYVSDRSFISGEVYNQLSKGLPPALWSDILAEFKETREFDLVVYVTSKTRKPKDCIGDIYDKMDEGISQELDRAFRRKLQEVSCLVFENDFSKTPEENADLLVSEIQKFQ